MNLPDLNGRNGFALNGIHPGDWSGYSVSEAGDINGDGIDDIIIGASRVNNNAGQSYVVYGRKEQPWDAEIDLFTLNGTNGFILNGISGRSNGDISVSAAGDVNRDGIDDILIGACLGNDDAGQSYVVFGNKEPRPAVINLVDLTGAYGANANDFVGQSYIIFGERK